jgi:rhodanese-related sulfurtransferase
VHTCNQVTPRDVEARLDGYHIIDVREPSEFARDGHIPGAALVPLATLEQVQLPEWHAPILVVCRSGRRSALACQRLTALGFTRVDNLDGGVSAWGDGERALCGRDHRDGRCPVRREARRTC